jgi:hypothetical protein
MRSDRFRRYIQSCLRQCRYNCIVSALHRYFVVRTHAGVWLIINGTHTCEIIGTKLEKQRNTHGPNSPITTVSSSTNVSGMIYDSDWLCVVSTEWTRQSIHGFQRVLMHEQQRQFKIGHNSSKFDCGGGSINSGKRIKFYRDFCSKNCFV